MAITLAQLAKCIVDGSTLKINNKICYPCGLLNDSVVFGDTEGDMCLDFVLKYADINTNVKKDTLVNVWMNVDSTPIRRYATGNFAPSGDIEVYLSGATSKTTNKFTYYKFFSVVEE